MSWGLNEGRGSGAVHIFIPGTERSTVALEKYAWDSGSEAAKTAWRLTSRALCMHTVSQQAMLLQRALRFHFLSSSIDTSHKCLYIRCCEEYNENSGRMGTEFVFYVIL
jgi:hypothetical protein